MAGRQRVHARGRLRQPLGNGGTLSSHPRPARTSAAVAQYTHHYAIWDDHDYGPNEANRSFVLKDQSLALFKRYWSNPAYGLPGEPGIFTSFTFRDIDFFLLDNRYHRNSDKAPDTPDKSMLGRQTACMAQGCAASVEGAVQDHRQRQSDAESVRGTGKAGSNFPAERADFLGWLNETGISGVLFLSGDVHTSAR